ncbi:MAG: hypothetical protein ACF8AM_12010, partial [Rhodopirellula sp. JB055]|uniref:hypothetical protein n=1 Tax=Rhodopirellula sp. JB055 TaxID=3342846 RepID=UPI00370B2E1C
MRLCALASLRQELVADQRWTESVVHTHCHPPNSWRIRLRVVAPFFVVQTHEDLVVQTIGRNVA